MSTSSSPIQHQVSSSKEEEEGLREDLAQANLEEGEAAGGAWGVEDLHCFGVGGEEEEEGLRKDLVLRG